MKKLLLIPYLLLIISRVGVSQGSFREWKLPLFIPYIENHSFGYCDSSFNIKIFPQFVEAEPFLEDCDIRSSDSQKARLVSTNSFASVVNKKGRHRIDFSGKIKYTYRAKDRNVCHVATYNSNYELISLNNKYGIKNANGDSLIYPNYDVLFSSNAYSFHEPLL